MDTQAIIERFILDELLLGVGRDSIGSDEDLISTRILDSLALMRLIFFIEERFNVTVDDEELVPNNFQTINHIVVLIERKQLAA